MEAGRGGVSDVLLWSVAVFFYVYEMRRIRCWVTDHTVVVVL